MAAKRERGENWDYSENIYLLELCQEKVKIIEDKRIDAESTKRKDKAWEDIVKKFSARYGQRRDKKRLKEQWGRMKLKAKHDYSNYKKERKKTGGGPEPKKPTGISEQIHDILPGEFEQLKNPYDDDSQSENYQFHSLDRVRGSATAGQDSHCAR